MSKELRKVFEPVQGGDQQIGAMEAVKEGIQAIAPGLSLRKIFADVIEEGKEQLKHGSHELASALFTGNTYVQYARKIEDNEPEHNPAQEAPQHEQERSGPEL